MRWFSLQVGGDAAGSFTDLAPELSDFAQTAAAMAALDLVISVDTAAAHLAGALGRPGWVLLSRAADWRWLRHGDRTPWYPTLKLFRQDERRDWAPVIQAVVAALSQRE